MVPTLVENSLYLLTFSVKYNTGADSRRFYGTSLFERPSTSLDNKTLTFPAKSLKLCHPAPDT